MLLKPCQYEPCGLTQMRAQRFGTLPVVRRTGGLNDTVDDGSTGFVAIIVASQTIIQERAPVAVRGRVFAVQLMLSNLVSIVPLVFLGGVADLIAPSRTLAMLGCGILLVWAVSLRAHRGLSNALASGA